MTTLFQAKGAAAPLDALVAVVGIGALSDTAFNDLTEMFKKSTNSASARGCGGGCGGCGGCGG